MNPLTNTRNISKLSEQELKLSLVKGPSSSWHDDYKDSAWIFVGGLPYDLTEGDILAVFSQYGEITNVNLVRDKGTGKQKGFAFICYEDQRSTVLAVDNFNGISLLGRTLRVDHVKDYKVPKEVEKLDEETRRLIEEGCAPKSILVNEGDDEDELLLPYKNTNEPLLAIKNEPSSSSVEKSKKRKHKDKNSHHHKSSKKSKRKDKRSKKKNSKSSKKLKKSKRSSSTSSSSSESDSE